MHFYGLDYYDGLNNFDIWDLILMIFVYIDMKIFDDEIYII